MKFLSSKDLFGFPSGSRSTATHRYDRGKLNSVSPSPPTKRRSTPRTQINDKLPKPAKPISIDSSKKSQCTTTPGCDTHLQGEPSSWSGNNVLYEILTTPVRRTKWTVLPFRSLHRMHVTCCSTCTWHTTVAPVEKNGLFPDGSFPALTIVPSFKNPLRHYADACKINQPGQGFFYFSYT